MITNSAIIYPTYDDPKDSEVEKIFKTTFPKREIIPINCLKLIEQGGSLHCSSMQIK
ncbi:MAG: agmatine deiminase family protein [Sulfurovum sp.]